MIRKIVLFLLTFIGCSMLVVGCVGHHLYWHHGRTIVVSPDHTIRNGFWEYRPADWPLDKPHGFFFITLRSIGMEWVSLEPSQPKVSKETQFYYWIDLSSVSRKGIAFRLRSLWIKAPVIPAVAALFLVYPVYVFLAGPYRRLCRRRRGRCPRCGYDLTGNTSGVCPECGERI